MNDGQEEFRKLVEYDFNGMKLNRKGFGALALHVARRLGAEVQYSMSLEGKLGDRFSESAPLVVQERETGLMATVYLPFSGETLEAVSVRFNEDRSYDGSFSSARFDVGAFDNIFDIRVPQQEAIKKVRGVFDEYFSYVKNPALKHGACLGFLSMLKALISGLKP